MGYARVKEQIGKCGFLLLVVCVILMGALPTTAWAVACPAGGEHSNSLEILRYATEDEDGLRRFTCIKCGNVFEQAIPATGHDWGPWVVDVAPTCSDEGMEHRDCQRFSESPHPQYRAIAALSPSGGHAYGVAEEQPATCTEAGHITYACQYCGERYSEETPALEHAWDAWTVKVEPTTIKAGLETRVCSHDATHVEEREIARLDEPEKKKPRREPQPVAAPVAEELPEEPDFFTAEPNSIDAVFLVFDGIAVVVFLLFGIPVLLRLGWVRKKKAQAKKQYWLEEMKRGDA